MIEIGKIYTYKDGRSVIVIQKSDKQLRAEVSDDIENKWNPFWIYYSDLIFIL